jgi:NAD(P)-dependent dehydrogenase (short-subunit alcohol dehydrogenase family)
VRLKDTAEHLVSVAIVIVQTMSSSHGCNLYSLGLCLLVLLCLVVHTFVRAGIRVNTVNPGMVRTEVFVGHEASDEEYDQMAAASHLIGRAGKAQEIASLVTYLLSDEASFVTGSVHICDGGWSLV